MPPIPDKAILLLSGGVDSVTLLYELRDKMSIHCLLVDYGQRHRQELQWAIWHARKLGLLWTTFNLPELGGLVEPNWIVPNRNAILLSLGVNLAVKAEANYVVIGCNAEDAARFPDCRGSFLSKMQAAVNDAGYTNIQIVAPFIHHTKKEILKLANKHRIELSQTWSCYRGGTEPCGNCLACETQAAALV